MTCDGNLSWMSCPPCNTMLSNTHTHITRMQFHASSAACSIATLVSAHHQGTTALLSAVRKRTHSCCGACGLGGCGTNEEKGLHAPANRDRELMVCLFRPDVANRLTAVDPRSSKNSGTNGGAALAARRSALGRSRGPCGRTLHSLWRHCFCVFPLREAG